MGKKLLLAIDGSKNSLMTLDYLNHLFQFCPEVSMVLFHVLPQIPPIYKEGDRMDPVAQKYLHQWEEKHREAIDRILKKSKDKLVKSGWSESQILIRSQERRVGLARDIMFEAEKGIYDALIIGRRGLNKIEEMFLGSVSNKIIQGTKELPVWVIGPKVSTSNILVTVDGSENAKRAADHLSFMLDSCQTGDLKILLLHVEPSWITLSGTRVIPPPTVFQNSKGNYEQTVTPFMGEVEKMLLEAGVSAASIKKKIILKSNDISKTILKEALMGGYGTIVMGRRGISKAKEFFMGSVSSKILNQAKELAVWIVN